MCWLWDYSRLPYLQITLLTLHYCWIKVPFFIQGLGSRIRVDQTNPDGETETKYYDIGQPIVVTMSSDVTETSNTLAINGFQSSLTVILDGVNIKTSDRAAVSVSSTCDVTIKLSGINRLTGAYNYAGLQKNESTNGKLYIEDATGSGELIATGGVGAAGIGTNYSTQELQKTNNIVINSGKITARGVDGGAGIGSSSVGSYENITINGGTVYAYGSGGISPGIGGSGSGIFINGGVVHAYANGTGDAIGSTSGGTSTNRVVKYDAQVYLYSNSQDKTDFNYNQLSVDGFIIADNWNVHGTRGKQITTQVVHEKGKSSPGVMTYYMSESLGTEMSTNPIPVPHTYVPSDTADCNYGGVKTYTCSICGDVSFTRYSEELGHSYEGQTYVSDNNATCTDDGTKTKYCVRYGKGSCNEKETIADTGSALGHAWSKTGMITKQPTCTAKGIMTYTCTREGCGEQKEEDIDMLPHSYSNSYETNETEHWRKCSCGATTDKADHEYDDDNDTTCNICGYERTITPPAHEHSYTIEDAKPEALKSAATCTQKAVYYKSCTCSEISKDDNDTFESGELSAHDFTAETVDAKYLKSATTCTAKAVYYKSCKVCGERGTETFETGNVLGHDYGAWTIVLEPTAGTKGEREHTCVNCNHKETEAIPATGKFVDIPAGSYYEDAIIWAAGKGITSGTDTTHFSPNSICTRAEAVSFLWRAAGSPAPEADTMRITDVPKSSYYYDAVLWAVENGITAGTTETTFSPNANCTRAQAIAFLWRAEKSPAAEGSNPFTDVSATEYYYDAVLWAVENDVTVGTSKTTYGPNEGCTRAQIVTFLWRWMK